MPEQSPRNILLILSDQLSANALGHYGCGWVETPNLDRLGSRSVAFSRGYSVYPVCVPCRTSIFYGAMPHQVLWPGTETDMGPSPDNPRRGVRPEYRSRELGKLLANAGYDCAYAGKWHVEKWGPTESLRPEYDTGFRSICPLNDRLVPARCREFLEERDQSKPFFLVASFDNPHNICEWAVGQSLPQGNLPPPPPVSECPPLPPNFPESPYEPAAIRSTRQEIDLMQDRKPDDWRRYRWAYHRLVEKLDEQVGKLLDVLDEQGLWDNTLVIFTSDHGDMQGAHRLTQKTFFYEEAARVPLFLCGPGLREGRRTDLLADNALDVYATICDAAGIQAPEGSPGRSLLPLLTRNPEKWREALFAEVKTRHFGLEARLVRTARHKYIVFDRGAHREQLFDLEQDPGEMSNLAACSRYDSILEEHRERLRNWLAETGDPFGGGHYAHPETPFLLPGDEYPPG